nr:IucA/IucC family protein [Acinetobacter sp. Marseille-Q1620]
MLDRIYTAQLQKIIDTLYMENYGDFQSHIDYQSPYLIISLDNKTNLLLKSDKRRSVNPFHIISSDVLIESKSENNISPIALEDVFNYLSQANWWPSPYVQKAIQYWRDNLSNAEKIPSLLAAVSQQISPFISSELLGLATDRAFHPFAHAKGQLSALFKNQEVKVYWWAFRKNDVIQNMPSTPSQFFDERQQMPFLANYVQDTDQYIALPLLETQHQFLIYEENKYAAINLQHETVIGLPTSSLRTLFFNHDENVHLKLSTNAKTLGAIRSMPARYMCNGYTGYKFLKQLIQQDAILKSKLNLSDETNWWVLGKQEPLVENQGVIGCQIRQFPSLQSNPQLKPVTMSALSCSYLNPWETLNLQGDVWTLLKNLCTDFITTFLTLWSYGVLPECHGQNTLVCYENNQIHSFILRDHDTLRICPSAIEAKGLTTPLYSIDTSTPNSLVLKTQTELLDYFITLGLQINLYPIALVALKYSSHSEIDFWHMLHDIILKFTESQNLDETSKELILEKIFQHQYWPYKQLMTPLLSQEKDSTGMPSRIGQTDNPYHALKIFENTAVGQ